MKYLSLMVLVILSSAFAVCQSTTYRNNEGTNYVNGMTGKFNKTSFTWTITKNKDSYNIKTNALTESFNVTYSYYDNANMLYVYKIVGVGDFDGSRVSIVMSTGKLSDYAKGITSKLNLLAILFEDNTGYMYKLNK
ncbi:MAG: hypothetical protein K8R35_01835 [Bacteroidales bacterium]|nr:hypothetical protein [Bacteroidales bacterium]